MGIYHSTYAEFVNYSKNRERHPNCRSEDSRDTGRGGFAGTDNFEEAYNYATQGWDVGLEKYQLEDGVFEVGGVDLQPSLAGCLPHVQNFIQGFPQQMYQLTDLREYNLPKLHLVVNLNYSHGVEKDDVLRFTDSIVKYINSKAGGYNIKLTGVFSLQFNSSQQTDIVVLKDYDESLVINNVAFAFHPSFFRTIWFGVTEGRHYWNYGYGMNHPNYKRHVEEYFSERTEKDEQVMYFKSLMTDGLRFDFTPDEVDRMIL